MDCLCDNEIMSVWSVDSTGPLASQLTAQATAAAAAGFVIAAPRMSPLSTFTLYSPHFKNVTKANL